MQQADIQRITTVLKILDERQKRVYLAAEATALGYGGISEISRVSHISRTTIAKGQRDYDDIVAGTSDMLNPEYRIRQKGGGRKSVEDISPEIEKAILDMVDKDSYGNPENPLRWTTKSTRHIAEELEKQGYQASHVTVARLLTKNGFTLQENRKLNQVGKDHPDRDSQFKFINDHAKMYMEQGNPVISIDCKKKENVGNFKNFGCDWHKKSHPTKVNDHDWSSKHAAPYGIYDTTMNEGFVNVGISSDTAQFAVNSIREWWIQMGKQRYPNATVLYITADGGGSNGSRNRLWKSELQVLSDELGFDIVVSHFPPGTSKWNKIEHRLFSQISKNWRNKPLDTYETIVNLIGATKAKSKVGPDLKVSAQLDSTIYQTGIKIDDTQFSAINIIRDSFHGEWNYTIAPSLLSPVYQIQRNETEDDAEKA